MQQQIKKPGFLPSEPVGAQPKDLSAQIPDISQLLEPKRKRTITRCAGCNNPNCRQQPIDVEVED